MHPNEVKDFPAPMYEAYCPGLTTSARFNGSVVCLLAGKAAKKGIPTDFLLLLEKLPVEWKEWYKE